MKNLRKLNKEKLKTIKGGRPPIGCNDWDNIAGCCRAWAPDYCGNTTCPNSPPPSC
ncbi:bacteriocin-like protein [Chryseobacterium flavum]|uniref:bacteriocin-like protein n=1 Tax=Chryseobacterium flavum TaxID=415851 RepID=UPI003A520F5C